MSAKDRRNAKLFMDNQKFKQGDLVKLKESVIPVMTVMGYVTPEIIPRHNGIHSVHKNGDVICQWFAVNTKEEDVFPEESLELVTEK